MSNKNSNFPTNQLNKIDGKEETGKTVTSLIELSKWGTPTNERELEERLDRFFDYCIANNMRPGIEGLCLSLGISRQTFNQWISGNSRKSNEWVRLCTWAKQVTIAFIENASMSGHINPATACFCLKNWAGYTDTKAVVESENTTNRALRNYEDIPMFNTESEDNTNE